MPRRAIEIGERTYLRRPSIRDRDEFLSGVTASRRLHRSWVSPPSDAGAFEGFLRRTRRVDAAAFLVCRTEDDAIAGVVTASQIFMGPFRSAYLGYYAFAPLARRGYMTEGVALVLDRAFGPIGLHRLEANIQPGNEASRALARRLGFRLEGYSPRYLEIGGRWRDHERWAILAEEWRPR